MLDRKSVIQRILLIAVVFLFSECFSYCGIRHNAFKGRNGVRFNLFKPFYRECKRKIPTVIVAKRAKYRSKLWYHYIES